MHKVLFVDDEENILSSLRRQLRKVFEVHTDSSPESALEKLNNGERFAVVVSDYRMPGMNGVDFLGHVRKICPDSTRVMLTGYADLDNAIKAVNDGNVFRFLTKPCPEEKLLENLKEAVRQYELVTAKKILLEKTLKGSIELVTEITQLVHPDFGANANVVKRQTTYLAKKKQVKDLWRYEIAAMLCQLGSVILPETVLTKRISGDSFNPEELQLYEMHPMVAQGLISKLPRLEKVGAMVEYQMKGFDGSGIPRDGVEGEKIPLGGRILKIVLDYNKYLAREGSSQAAFKHLEDNYEKYDPELMYYFEGMLGVEARYVVKEVMISELLAGMIFYEDVVSDQGALLFRKSLEIDKSKIDRLNMYAKKIGINEPLKVLVPG
ncbi:HD domain-containing phosphohydrolase [Maridesulfovibrio bastinii]|jgi:response regulator RpfG family c-di-GMP phosphodiesterase|uniref:HD domain-containing phosphohydrolase n=1 Tax=Maridesulfovibrio bastinii TaxID=47157 RepID=UPI0004087C6D|nr:HD domain-containing phosphohydrolase [Maridesulfovibrio bastinii]